MSRNTTDNKVSIEILIDIKKTKMTLYEVLIRIDQIKSSPSYIDSEIYLDGDLCAIVAKTPIRRAAAIHSTKGVPEVAA